MAVTFAAPWLLTALVIPLIAGATFWYATRARREAARRLGGPLRLRYGGGMIRGAFAVLVVTAMVLAVFASARPLWGEGTSPLVERGIDLVIAFDVSRSMEAQDIEPSRAEAASNGIAELLTHLAGSRVGLVTFAGSAFTRSPLTHDQGAIASLVARSQGEAPLVTPGTDIHVALQEAFKVLDVRDPAASQAILLVSDGEDFGGEYPESVVFASRNGIRVYTVFVGTTDPAPLPEAGGQTDLSEANPDLLAEIASATGGTSRDVGRIPGFAVDFRRLQQTTFEEVPQTQPQDQFVWFAATALLLLLVSMAIGEGGRARVPRLRRGMITSAFIALLAAVAVGCGSSVWHDVERGNAAYAEGDMETALDAYRSAAESDPEDPAIAYNVAAALYGLGDRADARSAAVIARQMAIGVGDIAVAVQSWVAEGNAAFLDADLLAARDAYRGALRLDPDDRDAKANLELVVQLLEPPLPPDPSPDASDADDGNGSEDGNGEPDDGPPDDPADPAPGGGPGASGEPGQSPAPGAAELMTLEEVSLALADALGELGPEISAEEAAYLLDLARRANELQRLPVRPGSGPIPR